MEYLPPVLNFRGFFVFTSFKLDILNNRGTYFESKPQL